MTFGPKKTKYLSKSDVSMAFLVNNLPLYYVIIYNPMFNR